MSKFLFFAAIFLLLFSALAMITSHQGFSLKLLIICFWVLLSGTLFYFFETYEK